ncbi:hypothetical protein CHGG_10659 [Chaetomium globosum CBS 148.51]|uniref:SET domain-containing protein n=1 Tax=Chaetomium globosum (strain ATCC 6205 / CBS 148.51 / DSM 1962 / NBRC 6347 / NRRL 1970) TaxID=306901 RepID=Q2GMZ5_CHAGB|nr:uncharacterized protein CHGG_10659 [Chaetomium globosum CBS 148.51]EAQ84255.1 hypothetical protein CHGG_10659 [Chaetomium globosum CBS 148.51]
MSAKAQLTRTTARLAEQTRGEYKFKQLHAEAAKLRPPYLDRATYIGPVRVQDAGPGGRGLFTTEAVKAGDLLFCKKAFACVFSDADAREAPLLLDPEAGGGISIHSDLINMAIQKLHQNPSLIPTITKLHHGSYQPVTTARIDGRPIIDSFLIHRIVDINTFSNPLTTLAALTGSNASKTESSGIWPLASYLNHSCMETASRAFIADFLIARATCDLPANAELTWAYRPASAASDRESKRNRERMLRQWGYECHCALCADAKGLREAVVVTRRALVEGVWRTVGEAGLIAPRGVVLGTVDSAVEALEGTYARPAEEVPRLEAMGLMLRALEALGHVIEGGERGTVVVRKWGMMVGPVVECWMLLRDTYQETAPELVAPAEEYARTAYRIVMGEDETLDQFPARSAARRGSRYPSVATQRPSTSDRPAARHHHGRRAKVFLHETTGSITLEKVYSHDVGSAVKMPIGRLYSTSST